MNIIRALTFTLLIATALPTVVAARVADGAVARTAADTLAISWSGANPVDVYEADREGFALKDGKLLSRADRDGRYTLPDAGGTRRYFALVDTRDNDRIDVAERQVPLAHGSNFRDIGGYVGAGGKHVRWGLIYRSAGQPLLEPDDLAQIKQLGLGQLVDLRSSEERVIAPTRIQGVPYSAVGYSMADLFRRAGSGQMHNGTDVYHAFPELLAPQLRLIFDHLLHRTTTPIAYNCSAGQDRTGFATAMVLSALGVRREAIVEDYYLSTQDRRPAFELPKLDPAAQDPVERQFAAYQQRPDWNKPQPLKDAGGPFLRGAFDEIDAKWGSVDAYLQKEVGVGPVEIAALRRAYLQ